jgi:hypothetical protein
VAMSTTILARWFTSRGSLLERLGMDPP